MRYFLMLLFFATQSYGISENEKIFIEKNFKKTIGKSKVYFNFSNVNEKACRELNLIIIDSNKIIIPENYEYAKKINNKIIKSLNLAYDINKLLIDFNYLKLDSINYYTTLLKYGKKQYSEKELELIKNDFIKKAEDKAIYLKDKIIAKKNIFKINEQELKQMLDNHFNIVE